MDPANHLGTFENHWVCCQAIKILCLLLSRPCGRRRLEYVDRLIDLLQRTAGTRLETVALLPADGAGRDVVGILRGAVSGQLMVSDQAARSIG
jgi:hypothetical protein